MFDEVCASADVTCVSGVKLAATMSVAADGMNVATGHDYAVGEHPMTFPDSTLAHPLGMGDMPLVASAGCATVGRSS